LGVSTVPHPSASSPRFLVFPRVLFGDIFRSHLNKPIALFAILFQTALADWDLSGTQVFRFKDLGDTLSFTSYRILNKAYDSAVYEYSSGRVLQSVVRLHPSGVDGVKWDTLTVDRYAYDGQRRLSSITAFVFQRNDTGSGGKLTEEWRGEYHYSGGVLDSLTWYSGFLGGPLIRSGQAKRTYLPDGEIAQIVYYDTSGTRSSRTQFTNGADGKSGTRFFSSYEIGEWKPYRMEIWKSNAHDRIVEEIVQEFDAPDWINSWRYTFVYETKSTIISVDKWVPAIGIRTVKSKNRAEMLNRAYDERFNVKGQVLPGQSPRKR